MSSIGLLMVVVAFASTDCQLITDENEAWAFVNRVNDESQEVYFKSIQASWNYNTNLTDHNSQLSVEAKLVEAAFEKEVAANASRFNWTAFQNETLKRIFKKASDIGSASLPEDRLTKLKVIESELERLYSSAQLCDDDSTCNNLDPGLTRILAESRDYDKLLWAWFGWRNVSGRKMRNLYKEFVNISNEAARANGYADTGEYWRSWYDMDNLREECQKLYEQLKPLYLNLHAYVKRKLIDKYGEDKFPSTGQIPAHLLGNMWAQSWGNLYSDLLQPFKNKPSVDVTEALKEQNYTAQKMFEVSEEFFTSLGLIPMPEEFWNHSMIVKPDDGRDVVCHASAWDFLNQKDFRIKQCTDITMSDLITTHHEMGHIQYYLQYKNLPVVFRRGANPGFHEAVGDVMSLSVSTPKHLKEIGLLEEVVDDEESDINFLLSQALKKIAFLPFGYLIDQWRWSVFNGETSPEDYNKKWWDLRCKYQGVSPPVQRTEDDFDPGAKYHIPGNTPYIRYFVSYVIQFQFHQALCEAANQTGPLYKCDIYNSHVAGNKLSDMLSLGSSKPWAVAMEKVTGNTTMDAGAIIEYFQPLITWLEKQNEGMDIQWDEACPTDLPVYTLPTQSPEPETTDPTGTGNVVFPNISLLIVLCSCLFALLKE
ncbi:unnamed protein product [Owenia fusiformis]|uniref:Angiotensin-converting enzyme n=1 Tax=Owenia fusiformis TaxID=6347 RepID=A0A8J1Y0L1_OWEFU|nr:unnamed protein product [Owenia fusiformis]